VKPQDFMKWALGAALLLTTSTVPLTAQTEEGSSQTEGEEKKDKEPEEVGTGRTSAFGEALATFWSVRTAVQASQAFDDNVFLTNQFRKSDTVTKIAGRISAAYIGRHTRFEASYMPEYNIYQRFPTLNNMGHTYAQTFSRQVTPRLELHWNANAYRMPSQGHLPFKVVNFGAIKLNVYNIAALKDGLNITGGGTTVGFAYRLTPRWKLSLDLEGASTWFTERGKPSLPVVTQEIIYSIGAKTHLSYAMTPRRFVGVRVTHTYFGFVGPSLHQNYQTIEATFEQKLPRNFTLSASAGPGFTEGGGRVQTSTYFDVSLARNLANWGFAVTGTRSSRVGFLQESVSSYSASFRAHRNLGRKWITNVGGSYGRSETSLISSTQLESASGNAQIGYRLTRTLVPFLNYGYSHQKALTPSPTVRNVNRNLVSIGIVYNPGSILGR